MSRIPTGVVVAADVDDGDGGSGLLAFVREEDKSLRFIIIASLQAALFGELHVSDSILIGMEVTVVLELCDGEK